MPFSPPTAEGTGLSPLIDHTLLKPQATERDVTILCQEALFYCFASVCVHPVFVRFVARQLDGSMVRTGTVVGFPLGAVTTATKAFETGDAVRNGAKELDMVIATPALKAGDSRYVCDDIRAVVSAAEGRTVKVILETVLLTEPEKLLACQLVMDAGAHFVKTSTGFSGGGATIHDVQLMRNAVGPGFGVKASGGIRTLADARAMISAGANRIGTSAGVTIVT